MNYCLGIVLILILIFLVYKNVSVCHLRRKLKLFVKEDSLPTRDLDLSGYISRPFCLIIVNMTETDIAVIILYLRL